MGRAEDGNAEGDATVQEFPGDHGCFNRLPHADVVGDEKADRVEFEGHDEGDKLVGAGCAGKTAQGAKGAGAAVERDRTSAR